jgi:hypothetical protein
MVLFVLVRRNFVSLIVSLMKKSVYKYLYVLGSKRQVLAVAFALSGFAPV